MAESVKFLHSRFLSASTLIGAQVRNPQDESLGDLKEAMIDTASGKIAYSVLSFGGALGVGNKLFAVPWDEFRVDPENKRLGLDVPRERLKNAPGFDADHWPNLADPSRRSRQAPWRMHESQASDPASGTSIARPEPGRAWRGRARIDHSRIDANAYCVKYDGLASAQLRIRHLTSSRRIIVATFHQTELVQDQQRRPQTLVALRAVIDTWQAQ